MRNTTFDSYIRKHTKNVKNANKFLRKIGTFRTRIAPNIQLF